MSRTHPLRTDSESWTWKHEGLWVRDSVWSLESSPSKMPSCLCLSPTHNSYLMNLWMKQVTCLCINVVLDENTWPWILSLRALLNSTELMSFDWYTFCFCLIFFIQLLMGSYLRYSGASGDWPTIFNYVWKEQCADFWTFTMGTKR